MTLNALNKTKRDRRKGEGPSRLGQVFASIIAILEDFMAAFEALNIQECEAMWNFKYYLSGAVVAVTKDRAGLPMGATKLEERSLASLSIIVNYLLEPLATDKNSATFDTDIHNFNQGSFTATDYAQQACMKTLWCHSVHNERIQKCLFVEGVYRSFCQTLRQWWPNHQHNSLKDLTQKTG